MVTDKSKYDYLRLILGKVMQELSVYETDPARMEILEKLVRRITPSKNLTRDLYILSHTKELGRLGKYLLYVYKKLDDNMITFGNLIQNVSADTSFIRRELLEYFSNPPERSPVLAPEFKNSSFTEGPPEIKRKNKEADPELPEVEVDLEEDNSSKIYMKLIQSDEHNEDDALTLPGSIETPSDQGTFSGKINEQGEEEAAEAFELPSEKEAVDSPMAENISAEEPADINIEVENLDEAETRNEAEIPAFTSGESSFRIKRTVISGQEKEKVEPAAEVTSKDEPNEPEPAKAEDSAEDNPERITISSALSTEIDEYMSKADTEPFETEDPDETANAEFLEYESEVKVCNRHLSEEMTKFAERVYMPQYVRTESIRTIMETSLLLEERSRGMSFEVISNIYKAIYLSFERISEGKYDMSESTVNLLKQGLELIESLIRGEDYYVYKSTLKSIENIRKNLSEAKTKKEEFANRARAKEQIQKELNERYPLKEQKQIVNSILSLIRNIEGTFRSVQSTEGEFHTYESLSILATSFNSFKEIVRHSNELTLPALAQMSEAGYNFVKYLCNYRKDPALPENREILDYLVYSLKSLLLGREVEDTELFISYLNDPIRIYSKNRDHQINPN